MGLVEEDEFDSVLVALRRRVGHRAAEQEMNCAVAEGRKRFLSEAVVQETLSKARELAAGKAVLYIPAS